MARQLWAVLTLVGILSVSGCGGVQQPATDGPLMVVATTGMVADLAGTIGGDRVAVTALMGPGVDPHLYRAREGDIRRLQEARLVLFSGLHLEARLAEVLERMPTAAAVTDAIPEELLLAPPEFSGAHDPHVWFDVSLWELAARRAAEALVAVDPDGAAVYQANLAGYQGQLQELDGYVRSRALSLPDPVRVLITAHDAFNYFGRAYGFEVRGLQGINTASEAGAGDVQALAELVASRRIPAMFVESSVPPRSIEAVQAAVRARGFEVSIGGSLYSDSLGSPGTDAGTYIGAVRHNIDTIVAALSREEP